MSGLCVKSLYRVPLLPGMRFVRSDMDAAGLIITILPEDIFGGVACGRSDEVCVLCGYRYDQHPYCGRIVQPDTTPFLRVLCDKSRVLLDEPPSI